MPKISPFDKHNKILQSNVAPINWKNPEPAKIYDLAVIGAGTAGLVAAAGASGVGAKVALIEKNLMGGDCLNYGCVPSKSLIESSRIAYSVNFESKELGMTIPKGIKIDFNRIMEIMREKRSRISSNDSVQRFKSLGVDVFLGEAVFIDKTTIGVNNKKIKFNKAVIATGARPAKLNIENIDSIGYLTNETVFNLTKPPGKLLIIGGGPIGCELAQSFSRLGIKVSLFHNLSYLLDREDMDASMILHEQFKKEGIDFFLDVKINKIEKKGKRKIVSFNFENKKSSMEIDEILVCTGRLPNVHGLNLEAAYVKYDEVRGVHVNDKLQTANKKIYAAGDVCFPYKFTHAADFLARIVIQNALFGRNKKASKLVIPWTTYTFPEIAHVGINEKEAKSKGIKIDTYKIELKEVDRAILSNNEVGFVKVHVKKGTDLIIGATIVAQNAGEMIGEITTAMVRKIGLSSIAGIIHPYPTIAEAIRKLGDKYNRTKLTPFTKALLKVLIKIFGK